MPTHSCRGDNSSSSQHEDDWKIWYEAMDTINTMGKTNGNGKKKGQTNVTYFNCQQRGHCRHECPQCKTVGNKNDKNGAETIGKGNQNTRFAKHKQYNIDRR